MKLMKLLLPILVYFFSIVSTMAQHPVLKPDKGVEEFVIPKMGCYYILDAGSNIARVDWTVSGGSFSQGSSQTSIPGGNFYGITVYWDNVKSVNGSIPQG